MCASYIYASNLERNPSRDISVNNMEANRPISPATKKEAAPTTTQPSGAKMSVDLPEEERATVGRQEVLRLRGGYFGYDFKFGNDADPRCNCQERCCGCSFSV